MKSLIEILVGLVLLLIPIYLWISNTALFGTAALNFLKGGLIWVLLLIGLILIIIGIIDLKE